MRTETMRVAVYFCAAAFAANTFIPSALAQAVIKPGLWQSETTSSTTMALPPDAEAKIAAMPAAQQAQVRSMMGGGMGAKPITTSTKSCIAASTNLDTFLNQQRNGPMTCTFTNKVQTANGASFDTSCTSVQGTATGHTQIHLVDSDHATTSMHMTIDAAQQGHTMHMTIESSGSSKYLGADCGDVKPYSPAAR